MNNKNRQRKQQTNVSVLIRSRNFKYLACVLQVDEFRYIEILTWRWDFEELNRKMLFSNLN